VDHELDRGAVAVGLHQADPRRGGATVVEVDAVAQAADGGA
jgi:hypothetical protein